MRASSQVVPQYANNAHLEQVNHFRFKKKVTSNPEYLRVRKCNVLIIHFGIRGIKCKRKTFSAWTSASLFVELEGRTWRRSTLTFCSFRPLQSAAVQMAHWHTDIGNFFRRWTVLFSQTPADTVCPTFICLSLRGSEILSWFLMDYSLFVINLCLSTDMSDMWWGEMPFWVLIVFQLNIATYCSGRKSFWHYINVSRHPIRSHWESTLDT